VLLQHDYRTLAFALANFTPTQARPPCSSTPVQIHSLHATLASVQISMACPRCRTSPNAQNAGKLDARSELSGFARKRSGLKVLASCQYCSLFWNEKMAACTLRPWNVVLGAVTKGQQALCRPCIHPSATLQHTAHVDVGALGDVEAPQLHPRARLTYGAKRYGRQQPQRLVQHRIQVWKLHPTTDTRWHLLCHAAVLPAMPLILQLLVLAVLGEQLNLPRYICTHTNLTRWNHDMTRRYSPTYLVTAIVISGRCLAAKGVNLCQQLCLHMQVLCDEMDGKRQG
jgi:hypothetical protein